MPGYGPQLVDAATIRDWLANSSGAGGGVPRWRRD